VTRREPSDVAILSARLARAYPALSAYSAASLATELCAIERAQHRHAERCCSGEDGGYVRRKEGAPVGLGAYTRHVLEHDPDAEERAGKRIARAIDLWTVNLQSRLNVPGAIAKRQIAGMTVELQGDPRGRVLLLRLPGESEPVGV